MFRHNFMVKNEIKDSYRDGKRYYTLPNGSQVPSVTSVLSTLSKDHIEAWKEKVGVEEADKITRQAGVRGTAVHDLCEKYLMNDPEYDKGAMPFNKASFLPIKKILDENVNDVIGIEYPLYSYKLKTAGRTDLVADWQGTKAIIDFKTSKKTKREEWITNYFYQATCYSLMLQELKGVVCPDIVIIITVDHDMPQVFHKKRKDYVEDVVKLFTSYKD